MRTTSALLGCSKVVGGGVFKACFDSEVRRPGRAEAPKGLPLTCHKGGTEVTRLAQLLVLEQP